MFCQVKSGTIFDNVLVTDDEDLANQFAEETFSVTKDGEKKMKEKVGGVSMAVTICNTLFDNSKMKRREKPAKKQKRNAKRKKKQQQRMKMKKTLKRRMRKMRKTTQMEMRYGCFIT